MSDNNKLVIKSMRDLRALAFHYLYIADSFEYQITVNKITKMLKTGFNLEFDDDCMAIIIASNAIDQRNDLDKKIEPLLKNWKLDRLGISTLLILRMSIWELLQKKLPASIVINEAIELAKCFAEKDSYKFINGILDEVCKRFNIHAKDGQNSNDHSSS